MAKILVTDTETTGLTPDDKLVEIAGLEVECNWQTDEFTPPQHIKIDKLYERLIDPLIPIPPEAMAIHHITDDMVAGQESNVSLVIDDMLKKLCLTELDYIVAHNAAYDRQYLAKEFNPRIEWICTFKVAAHLWPDAPSHKNAVLYYYLGLHRHPNFGPIGKTLLHRAGPDTIVTGAIFHHMTGLISLEDMVEISKKPILQKYIRFGKHSGMKWDDVDGGYINWILGKSADFDEDVVYTARCQKIDRAQR